ncbi:hypothetical protein LY78DRAFT_27934 [Colletotrichum sublineola]|nr:hypothetical protein LY78DRAFT_27934 [Colletotrichum sublineola]
MHSTYPLLLLLWSLLSCTFAAPQTQKNKGLRYNNDIYTVKRDGDSYDVYTPYYERKKSPVTELMFPSASDRRDEIILRSAWNGEEKAHTDRSARLHLSDIIQAVASNRNANRPLESVKRIIGLTVVNDQALLIVNDYYQAWKQLHPGAKFPDKLTIYSSDPHWPSFERTAFYKAVWWTFKGTGKKVESIDIFPRRPSLGFFQASMWCHMK